MTDAIAQAAADMAAAPSSTEPHTDAQQAQGDAGKPQENSSTDTSSTSPATTAPQTGNVLVNETAVSELLAASRKAGALGDQMFEQAMTNGVIDPVLADQAQQAHDAFMAHAQNAAALPRESHLMLLEHKLAAMHAKFKTGERIVIDEFEQILGHIKAVL